MVTNGIFIAFPSFPFIAPSIGRSLFPRLVLKVRSRLGVPTLNIGNTLLQDLLKNLGVLKLLLDLGNNALRQLLLLADLHLALISNPRIQHCLGFCSESSSLLELVSLSLELCSFLEILSTLSNYNFTLKYLRNLEQSLGDIHDTA